MDVDDRPGDEEAGNLLIVACAAVEPEVLRNELKSRTEKQKLRVHVVVPASRISRLHWFTSDEDKPHRRADVLMKAVIDNLADVVEAEGHVGDTDPHRAVADALVTFPATEILFIVQPPKTEHFLEHELVDKTRSAHDIPTAQLVGISDERPPTGTFTQFRR